MNLLFSLTASKEFELLSLLFRLMDGFVLVCGRHFYVCFLSVVFYTVLCELILIYKEDLAYFFQAVVRPILEYACLAWHTSSLTKEQSKSSAALIRLSSATFRTTKLVRLR